MGSAAEMAQYFPENSTILEYELSNYITHTNGTRFESTTFNIYNRSISTTAIVPYWFDQFCTIPASWTVNETNTKLTLKHTFSEQSSSTLLRTSEVISGETIYYSYSADCDLVTYRMDGGGSGITEIDLSDISVDNDNFFESLPGTFNVMNYFDNTLGPGEYIYHNHPVFAVTDDNIMTMRSYTNNQYNFTHVADKSGKVTNYIYSFHSENLNDVNHIASMSYILTLTTPNNGNNGGFLGNIFNLFTDINNYIGLGIVLGAGLLIGLLIGKKRK